MILKNKVIQRVQTDATNNALLTEESNIHVITAETASPTSTVVEISPHHKGSSVHYTRLSNNEPEWESYEMKNVSEINCIPKTDNEITNEADDNT